MDVSYEATEGVAVITIDRPERKNALSIPVFEQLLERAQQAAADDAVGAVLVRGADGNFTSGLDLGVFSEFGPTGLDEAGIGRLQAAFTAYEDIDKPTVALIEGYCLGGGIQLAAACHLRLVAASAKIAVAERRWALVPDLGGTYRLPRLVGLGTATELVLTGRIFGAEEASRNGFAQGVVGDNAYSEALAFTAALAAGPGAVRRAPRLLRENLARTRDAALSMEARTQLECLSGPDFVEAVSAHLQKRDPKFVGR